MDTASGDVGAEGPGRPGRGDGTDGGRAGSVSDVMATEVVTAPAHMSLQEFIRLLREEGISGAPVLGEAGEVVGVASYADVVRAARAQTEAALGEPAAGAGRECGPAPVGDEGGGGRPGPFFRAAGRGPHLVEMLHREALAGADLRERTVGDVMTPALFWVGPDASLTEAAALLAEGHVHRALVFEDDRLVGLVTAFDLLAALARGRDADGGG